MRKTLGETRRDGIRNDQIRNDLGKEPVTNIIGRKGVKMVWTCGSDEGKRENQADTKGWNRGKKRKT